MTSQRVVVISDLHLGGRPDSDVGNGSQICHAYRQLKDFIDWLAASQEIEGHCELVINGDFVDFLAEDGTEYAVKAWTGDQDEVLAKLQWITEQTREGSDRGCFEALHDFVAAGGDLTILIGNHDVELSLPRVRDYLEQLLDGGIGRLRLIYDGEALTRGDLLIEHGNRYDAWNQVDHSALRQERSMLSRGIAPNEDERRKRYFRPPAGSLMVTHIINKLKNRYRFVDLLKPETTAVVPLLKHLDQHVEGVLTNILKLAPLTSIGWFVRKGRMKSAVMPNHAGNMGGRDSEPADDDYLAGIYEELGQYLDTGDLSSDNPNRIRKILEKYAARIEGAKLAAGLLDSDQDGEKLHQALMIWNRDNCFELNKESNEYLDAAKALIESGQFSTIVFGHTHLPKDIVLEAANGTTGKYLNTGTWTDVMHLPETIFQSYEEAKTELQAFVQAIAENDHHDYVRRYLTWAEIHLEQNKVQSSGIYSYCGEGKEREKPLTDFADLDTISC